METLPSRATLVAQQRCVWHWFHDASQRNGGSLERHLRRLHCQIHVALRLWLVCVVVVAQWWIVRRHCRCVRCVRH